MFFIAEIEGAKIMLKDIENAGRLGVDGVVFGCLTAGDIDMKRNKELIEAAGDMSITFHRAFDMCRDPFDALEKIELGFDRNSDFRSAAKGSRGYKSS